MVCDIGSVVSSFFLMSSASKHINRFTLKMGFKVTWAMTVWCLSMRQSPGLLHPSINLCNHTTSKRVCISIKLGSVFWQAKFADERVYSCLRITITQYFSWIWQRSLDRGREWGQINDMLDGPPFRLKFLMAQRTPQQGVEWQQAWGWGMKHARNAEVLEYFGLSILSKHCRRQLYFPAIVCLINLAFECREPLFPFQYNE